MVGRPIIALLLVVLLLPLVSAYGVEKVWLEWQGMPVKTISPTASLPGTVLKAKLTNDTGDCFPGGSRGDSTCTLMLKAGSLSAIPSDQQFLDATSLTVKHCARDANGIICSSAPFTFSSTKPSHTVQSLLRIGGNYPGTHSISVTIDDTTPRAVALDIGYCTPEQCYVSAENDAPFTVRFEDTTTSFDYKQVYVGMQPRSSVGRVEDCTGKECTGKIKVSCAGDGDVQTVSLIAVAGISSREDAQNPVQGISRRVTCTSASAKFLELISQQASGTLGATAGGSITYKAQVRAPYGTPRAVLDTQSINGQKETIAVCSREGADAQVYSCTWQVIGLKTGKHDVRFRVYDGTGSMDSHTLPMKLNVRNITMPENNGTVDLFTVEVKEVIPERLNRLALELAVTNSLPYPAYVVYDLQPRAGASVMRQELDQCWYKLPNETNYNNSRQYNLFSRDRGETRVLYPTHPHTEDNRLNIQLRPNTDVLALSDRFDVTCQLKLIVTDDKGVYGSPELENITFRLGLRESPLGTPGEKFVQEIKDEEEFLSGGASEFLTTLREVRATLDGVCQIMEGISMLTAAGSGTEAAGWGIEKIPIIGALGTTIKNIGTGLFGGADGIVAKTWEDEAGNEKFVKKICKQVNCRNVADGSGGDIGSWNEQASQATAGAGWGAKVSSSMNAAGAKGGSAGSFIADELTTNINAPNFDDSLVSSIMYQCVGGIVHNVGKWQDINCGYLQCLKEQSINGSSVAVCEQARDAKVCMEVTGEIMELPWARVITNLQRNLDHMLQNIPGTMAKFFANNYCKDSLQSTVNVDIKTIGCHLVKATTNVVDFSKQTQQVYRGIEHGDAICLQALCNEGDKDCKRSYNRIEQYTKYASYLHANAWIRNKQKQSGTSAEQTAAKAVAASVATASGVEITAPDSVTVSRNRDGSYVVSVKEKSVVWEAGSEQAQKVEEYIRTHNIPEEVTANTESMTIVLDAANNGVILRTEEDVALYKHYKNYQTVFGTTEAATAEKQSRAIASHHGCTQRGDKCASQEKVRTSGALADQNIGYDGNSYYFLGSEVSAPEECPTWVSGCMVGTKEYYHKDGKWYEARSLDVELAGDASITQQRISYWNTFDFIANIAAKWAYDEGYLNFLQTSSYGDWGRDVSDWSTTYISPEGWQQNLCNNIYDINDNDDGVILEPSDDSFTRVAGTFAAEVREITNESGTSYVYIYTIYIANPQRPVQPGQQDIGNAYNYRMDAFFDQPVECAENCAKQKDIIDGRFKLDEGVNFANGAGPRRGVLYLPTKYSRLCITFDEPFPSSTGKTSYCRPVMENVYDTGSPYVPEAIREGVAGRATGTAGNEGPQEDPDGTGNLEGEV